MPLEERQEHPRWGAGDKSIPEFAEDDLCDPLAVDVYCLGHMIQCEFLGGDEFTKPMKGFGFMRRLVGDMCKETPKERPTMDEVMDRSEEICVRLSDWKLRSRVARKRELWIVTFLQSFRHRHTQIKLARRETAAIPNWPPELASCRPRLLDRIFPWRRTPIPVPIK